MVAGNGGVGGVGEGSKCVGEAGKGRKGSGGGRRNVKERR